MCNTLAKQVVSSTIIEGYNDRHTQLLPREDVALLVWGDKITGYISGPLRFHASKVVARTYHIHQQKKRKWTQAQFKEVDWDHLNLALNSKADNYKIWRSKQTSGFCGTRVQVGLYSREEYPDERCPNCGTRETDAHLMRCPDEDRTRLLVDTVEDLEKWMETDGKTDPEIIYWVPKYLLMCDNKSVSQLGYMSEKMRVLVESQDKIGWQNFMEGYISAQFYNIQRFHLSMSGGYLKGLDWTKQFISKNLQITHSQWIYRNISLHDKQQGYLQHKRSEDLLQEISELSELSPDKVPEGSRYLLEVNFTELASSHPKTQCYWALAVNAALTAKQLDNRRSARSKRIHNKINRKLPSRKKLVIVAVKQQIRSNGMHQAPCSNLSEGGHQRHQTTLSSLIVKCPHPSSTLASFKSNKHLRKPD